MSYLKFLPPDTNSLYSEHPLPLIKLEIHTSNLLLAIDSETSSETKAVEYIGVSVKNL
jgi:hypothetical protein